ncbi:MAG: ABC transporter substrate-binding protein [Desulfatiglans sp.]|jgi:branched-chain amino acid transport system substrate-binding protein|nr:ABC transporter substrate-binding protein [Thermodesulfobacteriota bacterium]MEE4353670.1 ABC transporter substrate-binding protein [Desulfatiglans sp.]
MKEIKHRKTGFVAVALPVLLGLYLMLFGLTSRGECAEKAASFLCLADYTGPVAAISVPLVKGETDYFKEVNARGGINGIKINFINIDTRYNVARAVSAYRRYRKGHKVLVADFHSTPFGKALGRDTKRDKIFGLYPGDGEVQGKDLPGFNWGTTYQDSFAACLDWIIKDWKEKGTGGRPKVGYLSWDSAYGRESLRGGKEYADTLPLTLLKPEFFPVGSLDHTVYLQRLAKNGANYIFIGGVDPTPTNIMKDAYRMRITKNIQFINNSFWGPTKSVGVRMHPEKVNNVVRASFFIVGEEAEKHPAHKLWLKHRPNEPISDLTGAYYIGVALAKDFEAGLKVALKNVSYEDLDGEVLADAYKQLTGSPHREGLTGACAFSPTNHRGSMEVKFYRIENGKINRISDWVKVPDAVSMHKWD